MSKQQADGGDELSLTSKFNLAVQKILTDYGKEFTPNLDGNDLYHLASDIWDAHRESLATQRLQDRNALVGRLQAHLAAHFSSQHYADGFIAAESIVRDYYENISSKQEP